MKFEDLLMQPTDDKQKRVDLQDEVEKLEAELDGEIKLNMVLQCAMEGPVKSCSCLSSFLPLKVQVTLAELAMVEEEIGWLERKVDEVKLNLYQEKKSNLELKLQQLKDLQPRIPKHRRHKQFSSRHGNRKEIKDFDFFFQDCDEFKSYRVVRERRASVDSFMEIESMSSSRSNDDLSENLKYLGRNRSSNRSEGRISKEDPNKLSEDMVKCLIGIYLRLNQASIGNNGSSSSILPKHTLSCMNSKAFITKNSLKCICNAPTSSRNDEATSNSDPYCILVDTDGHYKEVGPYKNFIQITRDSLNMNRASDCFLAIGKLRYFVDETILIKCYKVKWLLMHKLSSVDLTFLTYKQKLAFWINIYNACIMHGFLQHGLPSSQEKLLALMNKAAMNVGGIVLNALAIEHFILRHPSNYVQGTADEKEMLLRHAYGLGYPEPNVTFALCRGSWSSPALRVYTSEGIVDELGRARVEYLEASVGVTSKKKIMVPKLLQWHMTDFADDTASLLEWIYSQLPQSGSHKKLIMECLNGETKLPLAKVVEIQPHASEFRYLMPPESKAK